MRFITVVVRTAYIQFVWIIELVPVAVGGVQDRIEALPLPDRLGAIPTFFG
jgi:hypothetical protein